MVLFNSKLGLLNKTKLWKVILLELSKQLTEFLIMEDILFFSIFHLELEIYSRDTFNQVY